MFAKFREKVSEWGLVNTLAWFYWQFLEKLGIKVCIIFITGAESIRPTEPERPSDYSFRIGEPCDLEQYLGQTDELTKEFLEASTARGDTCAWALQGEELAGFTFNASTRTEVTSQLDILIPARFLYSFKSFVMPQHRRMNISRCLGRDLRKAVDPDLRLRTVSYIDKSNFPSRLRSHMHPNSMSHRFGLIGWFTIFGTQIPFATRAARWIGVRFIQNGREPRQMLSNFR